MSCPWGKIKQPESVSLDEIISEEVAKELQAKEEKKFLKNQKVVETAYSEIKLEEDPPDVLTVTTTDSVESDELIARMLQIQFDKEYDEQLKRNEEKYNGASKVSISFDNYRRAPLNDDFESDYEEEELVDIRDRKYWDRFDILARDIASIPHCGYRKQKDGQIITKHDIAMNGVKNACKLLSFPPEFQTGDGENFGLKLSNKVFNSLKLHSKHERARRHKLPDKEDHAAAEFGIDYNTQSLLYKMINNRLLESINGIVSIGKEAVILHAMPDHTFPNAAEPLPRECAIKVFKTTLSEFKQRDKYIKNDYRFKGKVGHQTANRTVQLWAEKEMANLVRLRRARIPCPHVVTLKEHVLVMSFIGENSMPASKLKDAKMKKDDYIIAYDQVTEAMKTLYKRANLIHADLSEYNILWHNKKCFFIDVSQSVEPSHENAFHFLHRDCTNIINFFVRKGVPEVATPDELFQGITGVDFNDKLLLLSVQETFKMKPHLINKPRIESSYNFETTWEKIQAGEIPKVENISENNVNLIEPPKA